MRRLRPTIDEQNQIERQQPMMDMSYLNYKKKIYSEVYNSADSLDALIDPSDVDEESETWSEVPDSEMRSEIAEAVSVMMSESHFQHEAKELAIQVWSKDLARVKLEDLRFDEPKEAIKNGYQPYKTPHEASVAMIEELVDESVLHIPNSAWDEAYNVIRAAIADKLHPNGVKGESMLYSFNKDD